MKNGRVCKKCKAGRYFLNPYCGAMVCDVCDDHDGLVRCYCGWSERGTDGRKELEELGETIEPEE